MWFTFQKEFNINQVSEIRTIINASFYKLFDKLKTISNYCQAFEKAYNNMVNRLINNSSKHN